MTDDTDTDARIAALESEVESLRTAARLSEAHANHRDKAKQDVCAILGRQPDTGIFEIVQDIREMKRRNTVMSEAIARAKQGIAYADEALRGDTK
jgi:tellurite resistance protein